MLCGSVSSSCSEMDTDVHLFFFHSFFLYVSWMLHRTHCIISSFLTRFQIERRFVLFFVALWLSFLFPLYIYAWCLPVYLCMCVLVCVFMCLWMYVFVSTKAKYILSHIHAYAKSYTRRIERCMEATFPRTTEKLMRLRSHAVCRGSPVQLDIPWPMVFSVPSKSAPNTPVVLIASNTKSYRWLSSA